MTEFLETAEVGCVSGPYSLVLRCGTAVTHAFRAFSLRWPQIDFMKSSGELDKTNHMRKTDQSAYVEARARQRNLMKGPGSAGD